MTHEELQGYRKRNNADIRALVAHIDTLTAENERLRRWVIMQDMEADYFRGRQIEQQQFEPAP